MNHNYLHIIGACAIYQLKDGSITITTGDKGDASTLLSKKQIEDLKLDVSKIVGFDHELYLRYYEGPELVHAEFLRDLQNDRFDKPVHQFSILKTSCDPDNYQLTIWDNLEVGEINAVYHYEDPRELYEDIYLAQLVFGISFTDISTEGASCSPFNFKS